MCENFLSLWKVLNPLTSATVNVLLGFLSAWLLFVVTERRRAARSQHELRRALVAELENGEVLANNFVCKYARLFKSEQDIAFCANEIRWSQGVGRKRMEILGIVAARQDASPQLASLSDRQLVTLFSDINETVGTKLYLPILDRALGAQTFGFSAEQIQVLSMVRWQIFLLAQEADSMQELLRLSFTITDENNHQIVIKNHDQRSLAYARRAQTVLRAIRRAIELIR